MNGKVFLLSLSIIAFFIVPNPLAQWLARFLFITMAFSFIYSKTLKRSLRVNHVSPQIICYRYDPNYVEIEIQNFLILPIHYCLLKDTATGLRVYGNPSRMVSLKSRETKRIRFRFRGEQRGAYALGPLLVHCSDPLGLFSWQKRFDSITKVLVLPQIYYPRIHFSQGLALGNITGGNPIYADPTRYRSFRNYIAGDDPRNIHWPLSAKSGTLKVKEFNSTLSVPCIVALNLNFTDYANKRKSSHLERSIEAAGSFVNFWSQINQEIQFLALGKINEDDKGQFMSVKSKGLEQGQIILEYLAQVQGIQDPTQRFEDVFDRIQTSPRTRIIVISPVIEAERCEKLVYRFRSNCFIDLCFLDEQLDSTNQISRIRQLSSDLITIYRIPEYGDELIEEY
jgi:uncharacterized protein (DUF58 family)